MFIRILCFVCLLACSSLQSVQTIVLSADFELPESFYARFNAQLLPYGIHLKKIDYSKYRQEDALPPDPIVFFNCPKEGRKLLDYPSLQAKRYFFMWEPPSVHPEFYIPETLKNKGGLS